MKVQMIFIYLMMLVLLLFSSIAYSQEENFSNRLEVEADPLAYILSGHSIHVAYTISRFRFNIGTFGIKQPDFFLDNDAFSVRTFGFDAKADYLFNSINGFFIGAQTTYSRDKIGLKNENEKQYVWGGSVGVRTGYRFMLGKKENDYKGFYIVPWVAFSYSPNSKTIQQGGQEYTQASWFPFPTIHLGWRF